MCPHKNPNVNLTPSLLRADYQREDNGASTPPVRSASTTPTAALANQRDEREAPGVGHSAPGKFDVLFAACVFAGVMLIGLVLSAGQAAKEWFAAKRVCAWCKAHYGGNRFAGVTHGICPTCLKVQKQQVLRYHEQRTTTGTAH